MGVERLLRVLPRGAQARMASYLLVVGLLVVAQAPRTRFNSAQLAPCTRVPVVRVDCGLGLVTNNNKQGLLGSA
eukprot:scaffold14262_cov87-Phaeocystis_antarctica.AAC.3